MQRNWPRKNLWKKKKLKRKQSWNTRIEQRKREEDLKTLSVGKYFIFPILKCPPLGWSVFIEIDCLYILTLSMTFLNKLS